MNRVYDLGISVHCVPSYFMIAQTHIVIYTVWQGCQPFIEGLLLHPIPCRLKSMANVHIGRRKNLAILNACVKI